MEWMKKKPTEQDRIDAWNEVVDGRTELYRTLSEENKKNEIIFGKLYHLEFEGGQCWMCGKQWIRKEINTRYMIGFYYVPSCECFVNCPICESQLYDLQFKYNNFLKYCDNCGFQLHNTVTKTRRYGKQYKDYYNNLSEKEKRAEQAERF